MEIKNCELCHKEEAVVVIIKRNKLYEVKETMKEVPRPQKNTNSIDGVFTHDFIPNTNLKVNTGEEINYIHVGNKCLKLAIQIFDLLDKPFQVDVGSILRVNGKK